MTWQPLVEDEISLVRIGRVISEVADAIDTTRVGQILDDRCDRALLHAYVTRSEDGLAGEVQSAVEIYTSGPTIMPLFGGAARLAWTLAHLTDDPDVVEALSIPVERALERRAKEWTNYDLIGGLVGFGVYALERDALGLATAIVARLAELARPRGPGLAWHTPPVHIPDWQRASAPDGLWNFGLAHGVAGVIAYLARCVKRDIATAEARRLLDGAVAYTLAAEAAPGRGGFPAWQIGDAPAGPSQRTAWCYGDLGVAIALYAAGAARADATLRDHAIAIAVACGERSPDECGVHDAGICHGAAGFAHGLNRLYRASGDERCARLARTWIDRVVAMRRSEPIAGFPTALMGDPIEWEPDASLLTGATGVALVLAAATSADEPNWDRLLLVDV